MISQIMYRVRKSDHLFRELNIVAIKLKGLRDMVTTSRRISKNEWDEFLFGVDEVKSHIDSWRDKVVKLKERTNAEAVKPSLHEDDTR